MRNKGGKRRRGSRRNRREVSGAEEGSQDSLKETARRPEGGRKGSSAWVRELQTGGPPSRTWSKNTHIPKGWARGESGRLGPGLWLRPLVSAFAARRATWTWESAPPSRSCPVGWSTSQASIRTGADQLVYRFCSVSDESNDLSINTAMPNQAPLAPGSICVWKSQTKEVETQNHRFIYSGHPGWTAWCSWRTTTWPNITPSSMPRSASWMHDDVIPTANRYLNEVVDHPDNGAKKQFLIYCSVRSS